MTFTLGTYEVLLKLSATKSFKLCRKKEKEYKVGDIVDVIEIKKDEKMNRIRAKLKTETWITMKETNVKTITVTCQNNIVL